MWLLGSIAYEFLHDTLRVPSFADFGGAGMKEMERVFSSWQWAFAVLVIGLGPGIGEELWCRGFLGRGLIGNYGVVFGVIATSFFFGLIHIDPCQGTMAMVLGLWLHFVYLTTRSLLLPMLLHFLNNSCSVLATRLPSLELLDSKPQAVPLSIYFTGLVLLAAVAYALYQSRARLAAKMPDQIILWRPAFEGVECPSDNSRTIVEQPGPSLAAAALAGGALLAFAAACVNWVVRT
jgi:membrane protease YdiL (CAAX protease family)